MQLPVLVASVEAMKPETPARAAEVEELETREVGLLVAPDDHAPREIVGEVQEEFFNHGGGQ